MPWGIPWQSHGWDSTLPQQGHRFDPWSGNDDPTSHVTKKKKIMDALLSEKYFA